MVTIYFITINSISITINTSITGILTIILNITLVMFCVTIDHIYQIRSLYGQRNNTLKVIIFSILLETK